VTRALRRKRSASQTSVWHADRFRNIEKTFGTRHAVAFNAGIKYAGREEQESPTAIAAFPRATLIPKRFYTADEHCILGVALNN
jgi:hypothetical protein